MCNEFLLHTIHRPCSRCWGKSSKQSRSKFLLAELIDFNGRKKISSNVEVVRGAGLLPKVKSQIVRWRGLQRWAGTCGDGLEFALLSPWFPQFTFEDRWSARGASPLSQIQELLNWKRSLGAEGWDLAAAPHLQDELTEEATACTMCSNAVYPPLALLV